MKSLLTSFKIGLAAILLASTTLALAQAPTSANGIAFGTNINSITAVTLTEFIVPGNTSALHFYNSSGAITCLPWTLAQGGAGGGLLVFKRDQTPAHNQLFAGVQGRFQASNVQSVTNPGQFSIGQGYTILTAGTTNFVALGAANSSPGTTFVATATGLVKVGSFVPSASYTIVNSGTTDFTLLGAANSNPGTTFTASGSGTSAPPLVIGDQYTIVTAGTTNFTLIGAPSNIVGTTFTVLSTVATASGMFVVGQQYRIVVPGTTDFTTLGAANNNVGTVFTVNGNAQLGTGTALQLTGTIGTGNGTATQGNGTATQGNGTASFHEYRSATIVAAATFGAVQTIHIPLSSSSSVLVDKWSFTPPLVEVALSYDPRSQNGQCSIRQY